MKGRTNSMLLLGHLGITLGIIKTYENLSETLVNKEDKMNIDYRYALIGSLLPDIIDKPLMLLLSNSPIHSARYFAHSLIFSILILLISIFLILYFKSIKFLILTLCSYIHLLLDKIWLQPEVFLRTNYFINLKHQSKITLSQYVINKVGNTYKSVSEIDWVSKYTNPNIYVYELIGLIFISYYLIKLIYQRNLKNFIYTGKI
jgi:membrane-bound metal-dependent hydrolase YbcI (DUF457 family)